MQLHVSREFDLGGSRRGDIGISIFSTC